MDLIPGASASASALSAEKDAMKIVMENLANQHTTRGVDGKAYKAKEVSFEAALIEAEGKNLSGVKMGEVKVDDREGDKVYMPGHPHADESGMVEMSNVKTAEQMMKMMELSRGYEANLAAYNISRKIAEQSISIGQR